MKYSRKAWLWMKKELQWFLRKYSIEVDYLWRPSLVQHHCEKYLYVSLGLPICIVFFSWILHLQLVLSIRWEISNPFKSSHKSEPPLELRREGFDQIFRYFKNQWSFKMYLIYWNHVRREVFHNKTASS